MTALSLLWEFMKIGLFAFGGAYGAIPLITEAVLSRGWLDESGVMNLLGISESTPGPIMVNAATMTGFAQAGIPGAALATAGVVLPSFLIMLAVPRLRKKWSGHRVIRLAMRGVKPCLAGVICATGTHLAVRLLFPEGTAFDLRSACLLAVLAAGAFTFRRVRKKQVFPILLILAAAALGMAVF